MAPAIDTSLLKVFVACVEAGSISSAARSIGKTQPTVTERLGRLEDIVGGALLVRSSRGVTLTATGERLLPYARRIMALSDEALNAVGKASGRGERVVLGILEDLATGRFASLLRDLKLARGASIELVSLTGPAMRAALDVGRIDLALCDPGGIGLAVARSWLEPMVWVAGPGFDPSISPTPVILCSPPCRVRERITQALDQSGGNWRVVLESTTHMGLQAAVGAGLGVAPMLERFLPAHITAIDPPAGLPSLPPVEIALVRNPQSGVTEGLLHMISEAMIAMMSRSPADDLTQPSAIAASVS